MATFVYDKARDAFLNGLINWGTDDIRATLVKATYVPSQAADQFYSSVAGGDRIAVMAASLTTKTSVGGVADCDDATYAAVTSASAVVAAVIYKFNASDAAARLIAYIDNAVGLPVTPNGGDMTISWDNGANKLFKL